MTSLRRDVLHTAIGALMALAGMTVGNALYPDPPTIIVRPQGCGQTAYNGGRNYEYRVMRYRWRHV